MTHLVLTRKSTMIMSGNKIKVLITVFIIEKQLLNSEVLKSFFLTNGFIANLLLGLLKFQKFLKLPKDLLIKNYLFNVLKILVILFEIFKLSYSNLYAH